MTPPRRHAGDILHLLPGHALPISLGRTTRGRGIQYAVTATPRQRGSNNRFAEYCIIRFRG